MQSQLRVEEGEGRGERHFTKMEREDRQLVTSRHRNRF